MKEKNKEIDSERAVVLKAVNDKTEVDKKAVDIKNYDIDPDEKDALLGSLLFDTAEEVICIDPDTGRGKTLFAQTKMWQKTQGIEYPFDETIKKCLLSYSIDSDMEDLIESMQLKRIKEQLAERGNYWRCFIIQSDVAPIQLKKASFFQNKHHIWFIIRDITEDYRRISKNLDEIDDSYRAISEELGKKNVFWNLMNRNIRIPLHSIIGLTRMAAENIGEDTALDSYLRKISMSGSYMNEMIDDILDLRQIASDDIHLRPRTVRLQDFLETIGKHIEPVCERRELMYSLNTDLSPGLIVDVDSHVLFKILIKLLHSAINYMVRGGRIQLNAHGLSRKRDKIIVEFSVDCIGIVVGRERLKVLLQPYDMLPEMLEEDSDFLDISLIILKRYAQAMGSNVLMVESHESRGTRISLSLTMDISSGIPKGRGVANGITADDITANDAIMEEFFPKMNGLHVLVVDDDDINLDVAEKVLKSRGVDVVKALNGQEALDAFEKYQGRFDMIIMDVVMPVMDGLEATKRIRAMENIPSAKTVPIIAMTANGFYEDFEESFQAGMNAHLVKPVEPEWLFRVMANILQ